MKKTWKPVALAMAILLMMGTLLTGCGGNGGGDPIVGKWSLTNVEVNGTVLDVKTFIEQYGQGVDTSELDVSFDVKEDGTFTGVAGGQTAEGTWEKGTDSYTLTVDDQDQAAKLEDGKLVFEYSDMKMILTK